VKEVDGKIYVILWVEGQRIFRDLLRIFLEELKIKKNDFTNLHTFSVNWSRN
jgi:hypothetical protein